MIWVTWRQHRVQAIMSGALLCAFAIFAIAVGTQMRSAFSHDGLAACLARSGGTGCPAAISSFLSTFNGGLALPANLALLVVPVLTGVVTGAPLLGRELETGTWRLAWSQTVPRTRWLATKLALVIGGLTVFGAAVTGFMTWYRQPLDRLTSRLQPPQFYAEGVAFTCSLLCAFGLAVLAGLLLRNTIGAMVVAYIAWEIPTAVTALFSGPIPVLPRATMRVACQAACPTSSGAGQPVTGHPGDMVLGMTPSGHQLVVTYLPADRFWTLQFIDAGIFLAIAAAALATAIWLLHRRTT